MSDDGQQLKEEEKEEAFTLVTSRRKTKFNRKPAVTAHSLATSEDKTAIDENSVLK